jgi:hypothetical protein
VAGRLLTGANAMHGAGMAHLELKPGNCGMLRAGGYETALLLDLGSWKPTTGERCLHAHTPAPQNPRCCASHRSARSGGVRSIVQLCCTVANVKVFRCEDSAT